MTNYMMKSGTGSSRICFTNPALAGFPKSKSGTALIMLLTGVTRAQQSAILYKKLAAST